MAANPAGLSSLVPIAGFGMDQKVARPVWYVSPYRAACVVGRRVVVFATSQAESGLESPDSRMQIVLPVTDKDVKRITALAMSDNRKLIAVASFIDQAKAPLVSVFSLVTQKLITQCVCPSGTTLVIDMSFSPDNKEIVCAATRAGATSMCVFVLNMDKLERPPLAGTATDNISSVFVNPFDRENIVSLGKKCLRSWSEYGEALTGEMMLAGKDLRDFVTLCWPSEKAMIVSAEDGDLVQFQSGVYYKSLQVPGSQDENAETEHAYVQTLETTATGFVAVTTDGFAGVYVAVDPIVRPQSGRRPSTAGKDETPKDFALAAIVSLDRPAGSPRLSFAATSSRGHGEKGELFHLMACFMDGEMREYELSFHDASVEISTDPTWKPAVNQAILSWQQYSHTNSIRDLAVARERALCVTIGKDRRCFVWDLDTMMVQVSKSFLEDPQAVAINSDGSRIVIAFAARVRLFEVTATELIETGSVATRTSSIKKLAYSESSANFAVSSGPQVRVHDSSSLSLISLVTQESASPVVDFGWGDSDNVLVVGTEDGTATFFRRQYDHLEGKTSFVPFAKHIAKGGVTNVAVQALNKGTSVILARQDGSLVEVRAGINAIKAAAVAAVDGTGDEDDDDLKSTTSRATIDPKARHEEIENAMKGVVTLPVTNYMDPPSSAEPGDDAPVFSTEFPSHLAVEGTGRFEFKGIPFGSTNGNLSLIRAGKRQGVMRHDRTFASLPPQNSEDEESSASVVSTVVHRGGIAVLANFCGKYIVSGSIDGSIFLCQITEVAPRFAAIDLSPRPIHEGGADTEADDGDLAMTFYDQQPSMALFREVKRELPISLSSAEDAPVVTRTSEQTRLTSISLRRVPVSVLENYTKANLKAERAMAELTRERDMEFHVAQLAATERLEEHAREAKSIQDNLLRQLEELEREKVAQSLEDTEQLEDLQQDYQQQMEQLEAKFHRELKEAQEETLKLQREKEEFAQHIDAQIHKLKVNQQKELDESRAEAEERVKEEQARVQAEKEKLVEAKRRFEEELSQVEMEYDYALVEANEAANRSIQVERDSAMALRGENAMLKRHRENINIEQKEMRERMEERDLESQRMSKTLSAQADQLVGLNKEIQERNFTIGQKENRVLDLKVKNQELEKYRFVVDYKISDLEKDLGPKENLIEELQHQIKEMDAELQRITKSHEGLELAGEDTSLLVKSLHREIAKLKVTVSEKEKLNQLFVEDVHRLYTGADAKKWGDNLKLLYHRYAMKSEEKEIVTKEDRQRMAELARQREHMEHSLSVLQEKAISAEDRLKVDLGRKVSENSMLISELNTIRKENRVLKQQMLVLENQIKSGALTAHERVKDAKRKEVARAKSADARPKRGLAQEEGSIVNKAQPKRTARPKRGRGPGMPHLGAGIAAFNNDNTLPKVVSPSQKNRR